MVAVTSDHFGLNFRINVKIQKINRQKKNYTTHILKRSHTTNNQIHRKHSKYYKTHTKPNTKHQNKPQTNLLYLDYPMDYPMDYSMDYSVY